MTANPPPTAEWAPHIWEGSDYFAWLRMLWANRLDVRKPFRHAAAVISVVTVFNQMLKWVDAGLHGRRVAATPVPLAPVFVVGHWRTGTTLLHELLVNDPQFGYPDTFACFEPNHLLLTERFFKTYMTWLMPSKRPMDNMAAGWDLPQEDEFALALLGLPSPYTDVAFPNRPPMHPGSLDLSGLSPAQLRRWKRAFFRFVQTLTFRDPRRLVLKSPPHTARIPVLRELFPDARFVHIVRDPFAVFPSTVKLWRSLARQHGFHLPTGDWPTEKVFAEFRTVYDRLEAAKPDIPRGRFHELRYEDLVADPVGEVGKVYAGLGLDGFDRAKPRLEAYLSSKRGYETNRFQLDPAVRAEVSRRWGDVIERYGYRDATPV